ncbi:MAG: CoA pyrophosphatase [Bacteroidota bacterium]|nr:CoA pyrophosphatase [Bacteroidota bacterium]
MNSKLIDSAVIVPIYRSEADTLKLVLIRRSNHGIHAGQLAFPGGRYEETDDSFLMTALRETEEEIGLKRQDVTIITELPSIDTLATGYRIYPFLAKIVPNKKWTVQESEVDEVLEVELNDLTKPEFHAEELMQLEKWPMPVSIPYYKVGIYKLWGASYRILNPLLPKILNGDFNI